MAGKKSSTKDIIKKIQADIKEHDFRRFYLLFGEETYLVKKYRDELKEAILGDSADMNFSYFSGKDIEPAEVRDIGSTSPFFADYRVLLLQNTGLFSSSNTFSEIMEEISKSTIVIFEEKEVDKRNKLYKFVQKNGFAAELNALGEKDITDFVLVKLSAAGKKIRESTMQYLLEQVNLSLLNLQNELEKLIAYTYGREEVTKEDIDAVCSVEVTDQIFKMLDAAAEGDRSRVMVLYRDLLALHEAPMRILALVRKHVNSLLIMKMVSEKYSKKEELSEEGKKAGIIAFNIWKYLSQSKRFPENRLREMLDACAEVEYSFKRGKISDQIGVELLLVEFSKQKPIE